VQVRVGQLLQQQLTAALRLSLPAVGTMSAALSSASAPKWPLVRVLMPQPQEALRMIREVIRKIDPDQSMESALRVPAPDTGYSEVSPELAALCEGGS
jgi:hypothetical protein